MTMRRLVPMLLAAALTAASGCAALAEVTRASPSGFQVAFRDEIRATPAQLWQTLLQLPRWWDGRHTYSGQASNLSLEAQAGGCWCERWGDGQSIQHAQVVLVQPLRRLRLIGSLGPLQELAVQGVWTLTLSVQDGRTMLLSTYRVAGAADAGLDQAVEPVDRVMGEQFRRLKAMAETGKAE